MSWSKPDLRDLATLVACDFDDEEIALAMGRSIADVRTAAAPFREKIAPPRSH